MHWSILNLTSGQLSHQPSRLLWFKKIVFRWWLKAETLFLDILTSSPSSYSQLSKFRCTEYGESNFIANKKETLFPLFLIIICTFVTVCSRNVTMEPETVASLSRIKLKRWNTGSFLSVMKPNHPQNKWQLGKAIFAVMDKS